MLMSQSKKKNKKKPLNPNMPHKIEPKDISDRGQKISRDWFDATIRKDVSRISREDNSSSHDNEGEKGVPEKKPE